MASKKPPSDFIAVATLGKTVGLKGDMKLHTDTDFPEQFVAGAEFYLLDESIVRLANVNTNRGTVRLEGIDNPEDAKKMTNQKLYSTYELTREMCELDEGEHFWFDIVGCRVEEDGRELGVVTDIERLGPTDYLLVKTDNLLVAQGYAKTFLIPYHEPFVVKKRIEQKRIEVEGGFDLLKAS